MMSDEDEFEAPMARVPSGIFGAASGAVLAVAALACALFLRSPFEVAVVLALVFGVFCGTGFTVLAAWTKRNYRHESVPLTQRVARAVLTGRAPASAVRAAWLPALDRSRRFWKTVSIAGPLLLSAMAVLQGVVLVSDPGDWRAWAQLAFFVVFTAFTLVQGRLQLRRIDKLRAVFETRTAS